MPASFSFDVDATYSLVRISMSGFFEAGDIARFCFARDLAHGRLRCLPNMHLTLVDIRGMQIQSQEAVAGFGSVLADPTHRSRRLAIVVTHSLARMQIRRAAAGRDVAYFAEDVEAAKQWLLSDECAPAASDAGRCMPDYKAGETFDAGRCR